MYGIADTGATQKYNIRVDTPCENKVKTIRGHQILLPYGSLIQETYRVEQNLTPLLSTRSNI